MGMYRQKGNKWECSEIKGRGGSQKDFNSQHLLIIYYVLGAILGIGFSMMPKIQRVIKSSYTFEGADN